MAERTPLRISAAPIVADGSGCGGSTIAQHAVRDDDSQPAAEIRDVEEVAVSVTPTWHSKRPKKRAVQGRFLRWLTRGERASNNADLATNQSGWPWFFLLFETDWYAQPLWCVPVKFAWRF